MQLGAADEGIALAVGEVDRLVHDATFRERLDTFDDAVDAVVDVREVEGLVVSAVDGDRLAAKHGVDEERNHPHHPLEVVVEPPVDVREAEHDVGQAVAAGVRVDERLARDLRRRIGALRVREVGHLLAVLLEPMDVAVDLAAGGEHDRDVPESRVLEHVERHDGVLERAMRLPHELMHLRVRREVDDEVDLGVLDAVDPAAEGRVVARKILEEVRELVRPRVLALVDAEHLVAVPLKPEREIRPDLARTNQSRGSSSRSAD